jgi:hypothetical protein
LKTPLLSILKRNTLNIKLLAIKKRLDNSAFYFIESFEAIQYDIPEILTQFN